MSIRLTAYSANGLKTLLSTAGGSMSDRRFQGLIEFFKAKARYERVEWPKCWMDYWEKHADA